METGDKCRVCSKLEKGEKITGTRLVMEKWRGKGYLSPHYSIA